MHNTERTLFEEYIGVVNHLPPTMFSGVWMTKEDKLRTGITIYEELKRTQCHVELVLNSAMVRKMAETITREQLTNAIQVAGVLLDQEGEQVMCDIVAQYLAEAAYEIWVFNGCDDDWCAAEMEYLDSEDLPTLAIGGFRLTFERKPLAEAIRADAR